MAARFRNSHFWVKMSCPGTFSQSWIFECASLDVRGDGKVLSTRTSLFVSFDCDSLSEELFGWKKRSLLRIEDIFLLDEAWRRFGAWFKTSCPFRTIEFDLRVHAPYREWVR